MVERRAPSITLCVPAWNAEAFIERTLVSLARQDYPNFRVLVSVDRSTDATVEICRRFEAQDPRFEVISQTERLGWIGNVNELLRRTDSKYCVFAFHDDVLEPTFLSELSAALEANPGAVLAFSDMDTTYRDGSVKAVSYPVLDGISNTAARTLSILRAEGEWYAPHRGLFRAEVGKKIGGLRRHLGGEFSADQPWLVHLSLYGEFVRVPKVLCHKHFMKSSLSLSWQNGPWHNRALLLACIREIVRARVPLSLKVSILLPFLLYRARGALSRRIQRAAPQNPV
jgi:glycosyltransferase involved in cell wall biosynthesis